MKLLGLIGSLRKLGNSELMVKEVANQNPEKWDRELIRLPALNILPCTGCFTCLSPDRSCPLDDDMAFLLRKIKEADAIVLAAPCYLLGPPAIIKSIQDRLIQLFSRGEPHSRKPCVTIAVSGLPEWAGYTRSILNLTAHLLGLHLKDSFLAIGANPGEVLELEENRQGAERLAKALARADYARGREESECPLCWGEIFLNRGRGIFQCALCGAVGQLGSLSGKASLTFQCKEADYRFSEKAKKEHYEKWLLKKQQDYIQNRLYYKALRNPYRKMEWWVRP